MFDPRDLATDPRTRAEARPRRDHAREREQRERNGHRREYDPRRTKRQTFQDRTDRAIADVGMYRNVAYRDLADAHFEGHPTRRGGLWIRWFAPVTFGSTAPRGRKEAPTRCSRSPRRELSGPSA